MKSWMMRGIPPDERVEMQTREDLETGCHVWTGAKERCGYGQIKINGKTVRVHRWIFAREFGEIPDGQYVLHHCDNPSCINPTHLFLGTQRENMLDMVAKGRGGHPRGAAHTRPMAKLTEDGVRLIRALVQDGMLQSEVARVVGASRACISDVMTGKTWRHV